MNQPINAGKVNSIAGVLTSLGVRIVRESASFDRFISLLGATLFRIHCAVRASGDIGSSGAAGRTGALGGGPSDMGLGYFPDERAGFRCEFNRELWF